MEMICSVSTEASIFSIMMYECYDILL